MKFKPGEFFIYLTEPITLYYVINENTYVFLDTNYERELHELDPSPYEEISESDVPLTLSYLFQYCKENPHLNKNIINKMLMFLLEKYDAV